MTAYATTLELWSPKHRLTECVECGRSDVKHIADGKCRACYRRARYEIDNGARIWALRGSYWSEKHRLTACRGCGDTDQPHHGQGLCHTCWNRLPHVVVQKRVWHTPEKTRLRLLKSKYGLTPEQFDELVAAQNGVCAVCGDPPSDRFNRLEIDHDHETRVIRGLLCGHCNKGIGLFKDEPERLAKAIAYLAINRDLPY